MLHLSYKRIIFTRSNLFPYFYSIALNMIISKYVDKTNDNQS